jgi:hypothetical protein
MPRDPWNPTRKPLFRAARRLQRCGTSSSKEAPEFFDQIIATREITFDKNRAA